MAPTTTEKLRLHTGLPPVSNPLTAALAEHAKLIGLIEFRDRWEAEQAGEEAKKLALYTTIRDTLDRRRPGGLWADVHRSVIPEAKVLYGLLDRPKYHAYEALVESHRQPAEKQALHLIRTYLEPKPYLEYYETLEYEQRLAFANEIATGLVQTHVGTMYLAQSLFGPVRESPVPLFSRPSLVEAPIDFYSTTYPTAAAVGALYIEFFLKMIRPSVLQAVPAELFAQMADETLGRFFRQFLPFLFDDPLPPATALRELEQKLAAVRAANAQHSGTLKARFGAQIPALLGVAIEMVNVWIVLRDARDGKGLDKVKLLRATAGLAAAVSTAQDVWTTRWMLVGPRLGIVLGVVTGSIDAIMAARGVDAALSDMDYSVAMGNALQGAGAVASVAVGAYTGYVWATAGLVAAGAAVAPLTLFVIAAVSIAGAIIAATTAETHMELWFEHNFFGSRWFAVRNGLFPSSRYFLWSTWEGRPDFGRQISAYQSLLQPLPVTVQVRSEPFDLVELEVVPDSTLDNSRLFLRQVVAQDYQEDWMTSPIKLYSFRPVLERDIGNAPLVEGKRRFVFTRSELTQGMPHQGGLEDWKLEVDVVPKNHPAFDWQVYAQRHQRASSMNKFDPDYLAPYLFVRRIRGW